MCELFGLNSDKEISISFSFTKFQKRVTNNPDGWGIGFYMGDKQPFVTIIKEPITERESIFGDFLKNKVKSNIFISHLRLASGSSNIPLNTHPFELMVDPRPNAIHEKSWIFAHNGVIKGIKDKFKFSIMPHGDTDSEYAFCYIIGKLREQYVKNDYKLGITEKIKIIKEAALEISSSFPNSLNFLLSDGYRLYAYYGGYKESGGLWHLARKSADKKEVLENDFKVILPENSRDVVSVVATKPLTKDAWTSFENNELIVFENGEIKKY